MRKFFVVLCLSFIVFPVFAAENHKPYAGFEDRKISSLSASDIEELERGGGWGLALPAELNNHPGPAHVLELRDQLGLSDSQVEDFQQMYEDMQLQAIAVGAMLIEAEQALDEGFRNTDLSAKKLRELIVRAEKQRSDLRFVHLSRHLASVKLLSPDQVERYNALRGYAEDPCDNVPAGHSVALWKKHNGCE